MRFIDEVDIVVQAGRGGNGCTSFHREKYKPWGGPDGGDGGKGGDVILVSDRTRNTLLDLHLQRHYRAEPGIHGQGSDRHGRRGKDRIVRVPLGTLVRDADSGEILEDLSRTDQTLVAARGGRGGRGNARFATPAQRAPDFSEAGEPGQTRRLRCELKLLADVGIVGFPNAGKSTLISRISAARPKIADYPFTTLVPHLGLVRAGTERSFVIADLPGILPGAADGVGLGLRFLRHIERSQVLLFLVDLSDPDQEDPRHAYELVRRELARYSPLLLEKRHVLAANKIDLPLARQRMRALERNREAAGPRVLFISAQHQEGLAVLIRELATQVEGAKKEKDVGSE
jgi:GTPase